VVLLALVVGIGASCGPPGGTGAPDGGGVPPVTYACTGPIPANATPCPGADADLSSDTARVVTGSSCTCTASCTPTPCSYVCDAGFTPGDGGCVPAPPQVTGDPFIDHGDGTVTDRNSGLRWLRDAHCTETVGGVSRASGPVPWQEAATWSSALADGTCGLGDGSGAGDWRLPSPSELMTLAADLAAGGPFIGIQSTPYWSDFTTCINVFGAVDVQSGAYFDYPLTSRLEAWPVRR
jgi:hypothetical protein